MIGYIKLYRQLFENPDYFTERFSRTQAWIDLLLMANYEDGFIYVKSFKVEVKRGQLAKSIRYLAKRWQWSVNTVQKFLRELVERGQINTQTDTQTDTRTDTQADTQADTPTQIRISLITIVNYEKFQGQDATTDTQADTLADTQADTQADTRTDTQVKENVPIPPAPPITSKEINKEAKKDKENIKNKFLLTKKKSDTPKPSRYIDKRPAKTEPIEKRKSWFKEAIREANSTDKFNTDMCNAFYRYWAELTPDGLAMKFEMQPTWETSKRLATWFYNEKNKWTK